MKKISGLILTAIIMVSLAFPALAASSKVTVKNTVTGSKPVTYTYDAEDISEIETSIKTLMTVLSGVNNNNTRMQALTITSESADGEPVNFKLRLSIPKKNSSVSEDMYSALDYYNIKVNSASGSLLYNSANEPASNDGDSKNTYKDIPLGTLNASDAKESKTFNISVSVNKDLATTAIAKNAKNLDWSIVSYKGDVTPTATPEPTEATKQEETETAENTPSPEETPSATAAPSPAATVKADKNGNYKLSQGDYVAGTDIDTGIYTMTGSGMVNIYSSDGALKNTVALKSRNDKTKNGVSEYVINLAKGERLSVDSEIALEPYVAPTASPTPSPTPKATAISAASSGSANNSKNNPKTGDTTPLAGVTALGITAIAGFVFLTIKKKNN